MPIKSQGTHIYIVDNITTPATPVLVKMLCPASVSGVGSGARDQIDTTDLDALIDRSYVGGLSSPATVSVPYQFDPSQASHKLIQSLKTSGTLTDFIICLSDGTVAPTLSAGVLTAPLASARSSIKFSGYISENSIEIATNDIIKGTLSIQRSGSETWVYKV